MALPRDKRQSEDQTADFAAKAVEKHQLPRSRRDPRQVMMDWLLPRTGKPWLHRVAWSSKSKTAAVICWPLKRPFPTIAHGRTARAAPDGYTLSLGHTATHVLNGAVYSLTYDVLKDFEPNGHQRAEDMGIK
jgi:hypothetical protein